MSKRTSLDASTLLINEYPLQVLPSLAVSLGLNEAIIVQQIHFWLARSGHIRDGKTWIYNTYEQWQEQFPFWSINTIKRAIYHLEHLGILFSTARFNRNPIDKSKWYTISYERLNGLVECTMTQNEPSMTQNEPSMTQNEPMDDSKWDDSHRDLHRDLSETSSTEEREGNAPEPEIVRGFFMPREYVATPLLIEQMTKDCPDIDVPHVLKRCMVTTFRRSILDPDFTFQKFCLDEQEKARDLIRRYPTRAKPKPLLDERLSQGSSDTIRNGLSVVERLYPQNTPAQSEEYSYGTDTRRLLTSDRGTDHHGGSVSRPTLRGTDRKLLDDPSTRAVSG